MIVFYIRYLQNRELHCRDKEDILGTDVLAILVKLEKEKKIWIHLKVEIVHGIQKLPVLCK